MAKTRRAPRTGVKITGSQHFNSESAYFKVDATPSQAELIFFRDFGAESDIRVTDTQQLIFKEDLPDILQSLQALAAFRETNSA